MNHIINQSILDAYKKTFNYLSLFLQKETGESDPIAAFQFACTYISSEDNYKIEPLLMGNNKYEDLLNEFIDKKGSILFSSEKESGNTENYASLCGEIKVPTILEPKKGNTIRNKSEKTKSNFKVWNDFLNKNRFGKYSIWLSLVDKSDKNWRFSIDLFLILNADIHDKLPSENADFGQVKDITELQKWKFRRGIFDCLYSFADNYGISIVSRSLENDLLRHAKRAAIAQVMARNASHNIGSHVLSRMIDEDTIKRFINPSDFTMDKTKPQYIGFPFNNDFAKYPQKLISSFNSYLKSRMDFIADITTGVPTVENSKWFFKELLSGIDKNRLLLERISGIKDFYFKIIARNFVNGDSKDNAIREIPIPNKENKFEVLNDLLVSIPNDVLGLHAFYIIIENIIRNCAKHGRGNRGKSIEDPLIICIDIKEPTEVKTSEFYEVTIYDNGEDPAADTPRVIDEENIEKYKKYFKEIDGKITIKRFDKLIFDQNFRLNQSILKEGALRQGAWGLIEMDASAAYLRKIPVEQIDEDYFDINLCQDAQESSFPEKDNPIKKLNILKAVAVNKKHLGYKMFLLKPREILIIDDNKVLKNINNVKRKDLLRDGILLCHTDSNNQDDFLYNKDKVYNHKLVIILSDRSSEIILGNKTGLSERILKITKKELQKNPILELLLSEEIEFFIEDMWKCYIKNTEYSFYSKYVFSEGTPDFSILEKLRNPSTNLQAEFYDHGVGYSSNENNDFKYKEIIYSAVKEFLPKSDSDLVLFIQLLESIHNQVVVLDERIQEYAKNGKYSPENESSININDIYKSTNIYVPSNDICNLGLKNFSDDNEYLKILNIFELKKNYCFFVIHLGIIEKLVESYNSCEQTRKYNKETEIENFLRDVICEDKNIDYNKIIIISGRGMPHNLPRNIRYLNYSIIAQYMIDLRFKYLLSEAIFSARRIK